MDPLRIVVRIVFAYVVVLGFTRISGSRTIQQADVPSFVIALVIGDMFDDVCWSEVPASQFVVGVATLFVLHLRVSGQVFHSGSRAWRHDAR
jgi:uncharacterized membrane protein YcaP (DUF421 family)